MAGASKLDRLLRGVTKQVNWLWNTQKYDTCDHPVWWWHCSPMCYRRSEEATFNAQETENFGRFCVVFATELVPYVNRCLRSLFPAKQLAQVLGVSPTQLSKMVSY